ncbi:MAG: sulfurtransferase [Alphaproteobacteria bacterium]|nr:sulfurtransferase [Alphaproteobacteria bacterium]
MDAGFTSALIEPEELLLKIENNIAVKIVDASFVLPGSEENPFENFQRTRIGRSVFFDIDDVADKTSPLPHMLPTADEFGATVSRLGISNEDEVVIYGQSGLVMGPSRAWWTFRAFGHDRVRVLNGGLPYWKSLGMPLNSHLPDTPAPGTFTARLRSELVRHIKDVEAAIDDSDIIIADARSCERFSGTAPEPRAGLRSGHIPGSVSVPCGSLVDPDTGRLKKRSELAGILETAGIDPSKTIIATCGSGVTACVIVLALHELGNKAVSVYDGSWSEWGQESLQTAVAV